MPQKRSAVREFFRGVGMLGKGFATWRTAPRVMLLGAIPALIVAVVYFAGLVVLLLNLASITESLTRFADDWEPVVQGLLQGLFALAFLVVFAGAIGVAELIVGACLLGAIGRSGCSERRVALTGITISSFSVLWFGLWIATPGAMIGVYVAGFASAGLLAGSLLWLGETS